MKLLVMDIYELADFVGAEHRDRWTDSYNWVDVLFVLERLLDLDTYQRARIIKGMESYIDEQEF